MAYTINWVLSGSQSSLGIAGTIALDEETPPAEYADPVITSTPGTVAYADGSYTYNVNATDADEGDTLTYSLDTYPTGMTIDSSTGVISWSPDSGDIGANDVVVRVTDSHDLYDTQSYTLTVYAAAGTNAPEITSTAVTSVAAGALYYYRVTATDDDPDDDLSYTLETAPTGMTIGQYSGIITWVPEDADEGNHSVTVRVTDLNSQYDEQSFTVAVSAFAGTELNQSWFDANGGDSGPWVLGTTNTVYRLQKDVTVDGTAFFLRGSGVQLNLNGHTITYGNASPLSVTNGGFETGSGTTVSGWDLTNAPSAAIASSTIPFGSDSWPVMWGDQCLKFTALTGAEYVISDDITIPTANKEYVAIVTPKKEYGAGKSATVTLAVHDATTDEELATVTADSSYTDRGFTALVAFTPDGDTTAVYLKITATPTAGSPNVYIDYVDVLHSTEYAVFASRASAWRLPSHLQSYADSTVTTAKVFNGTMTQGASGGFRQYPMYILGAPNIWSVNNTFNVSGPDTSAIIGTWPTAPVFVGCTINSTVDLVTNRMNFGPMVHLSTIDGAAVMCDNVLDGHPQFGLYCSGAAGASCFAAGNDIDANARFTECYGIGFLGLANSSMLHNTVVTERAGRGLFFDALTGAGNQDSVGIEVAWNTVYAREYSSLEYGRDGIEATALRMRSYRDGGLRDFDVHHNTLTAETGSSANDCHAAISVRISTPEAVGTSAVDDWGMTFRHNTFKAIVSTTDTDYWARAVAIAGLRELVKPVFSDNIMESNHVSFGVGDNDGYYGYDVTLIRNTMRKSSDGAARTHISYALGDSLNGDVVDLYIYDSEYDGGATADITFGGSGQKDVYIGWSFNVAVTSGGSPVSGATVALVDVADSEVGGGTTNSSGSLDIDIMVTETSWSGTTTPTETDYNDHELTVSKTGYVTAVSSVTIDDTETDHAVALTGA